MLASSGSSHSRTSLLPILAFSGSSHSRTLLLPILAFSGSNHSRTLLLPILAFSGSSHSRTSLLPIIISFFRFKSHVLRYFLFSFWFSKPRFCLPPLAAARIAGSSRLLSLSSPGTRPLCLRANLLFAKAICYLLSLVAVSIVKAIVFLPSASLCRLYSNRRWRRA